MKFKLHYLEPVILIVFFGIYLWAGLGNLWEHKITHDFPYGQLANDGFQHIFRPMYVYDEGIYKYDSVMQGCGILNVTVHYPMFHSHLSAVFAKASGLNIYDTTLLLTYIFICLSAIVMYLIIRKFNDKIAILSLPLPLFFFINEFYFGSLWGQIAAYFAVFFVFVSLWATQNIEEKFIFALLGIMLAASFLSHGSETIIYLIFLVLYIIYNLFFKHKKRNSNILIGIVLFLLICLYYLPVFYHAIYKNQGTNLPLMDISAPYTTYLKNIQPISFTWWILIPILIGFIYSFFTFKKDKAVIYYAAFMLIFGLLNYLGGRVGSRSLHQRLFWPVTLALLFGLGIYLILRLIKLDQKFVAYIICIVTVALILSMVYKPFSTPGLMSKELWDAEMFVNERTSKNASILFVYGDTFNQEGIIWFTFRNSSRIDENYYIQTIQNLTINREYRAYKFCMGDYGLPYRKSFFSFGSFYETLPKDFFTGMRDICSFDYLFFQRESSIPAISQYNKFIISQLLKNNYTEEAYSNSVYTILHNKELNKECIQNARIQ